MKFGVSVNFVILAWNQELMSTQGMRKKSMKKAKYYIYRNLHKGGFSVRLRGSVVDYIDEAVCIGVEFKTYRKGKYRHLTIVCDNYYKGDKRLECMYGKFDKRILYGIDLDVFVCLDEEDVQIVDDAFMCHIEDNSVFIR